jgi:DNA-binding transcriptional regulator YdaS (Cro superfamily)
MTNTEFRAALAALGMSQRSLALELGVHPVTVAHWARGARPIPRMVELAIQAIIHAHCS